MGHESNGKHHILRNLNGLLTLCLSIWPHFDFAVSRACDEFNVVPVFLRALLIVDVGKLFWVEYHDGSYVFLMTQFFLGRSRIRFFTLDVFKVLSFHIAEGLVLKQHVVHEFIPLDTSI